MNNMLQAYYRNITKKIEGNFLQKHRLQNRIGIISVVKQSPNDLEVV